jgi:hypothetical protein
MFDKQHLNTIFLVTYYSIFIESNYIINYTQFLLNNLHNLFLYLQNFQLIEQKLFRKISNSLILIFNRLNIIFNNNYSRNVKYK